MSVRRVRALAAALVVALGVMSAPTAGAATTSVWTLHAVTDPSGAPVRTNQPTVLGCVTAAWCQVLSGAQYLTTVSGRTATTVPAPAPTTDPNEYFGLNDLACSAVGACVAVGGMSEGPWDPGSGYRDELVDGTWTAPGGSGAFGHIACNTEHCVDIGTRDAGVDQANIDDRGTGGPWVSRRIATPWAPAGNGFYVAAQLGRLPRPAGACYVVGNGQKTYKAGKQPLFFYRSGSVWNGVGQSLPAGAVAQRSAGAQQLSAPSARNCLGLGTWTDTNRRQHASPRCSPTACCRRSPSRRRPHRPGSASQVQVDCSAVGECVGFAQWSYRQSEWTRTRTALLRLHNGAWTYSVPAAPTGSATGTDPQVLDVSCSSASQCVGVGFFLIRGGSQPVRRAAVWMLADGHGRCGRSASRRGAVGAGDDVVLDSVECTGARCVATGLAADTAFDGIGNLTS